MMKLPDLIETGFHDTRGIPICVGDLIRVKHFVHYRRREQMWLYFRVGQAMQRFVVRCWNNLDDSQHQCLLEHCGIESAEVLDGPSARKKDGSWMMFNQRERVVE